jgi:transcriptional regulator with XRE-family HTH domain
VSVLAATRQASSIVGPYEGSKSRAVVATELDLESLFGMSGDGAAGARGSSGRTGTFCDTLLGVMDDEQGTFQTPNGGAKIGQVLEKARKERGLTLDEVEHATKIRKRYLVGLEREDDGALPDAVYAQGFLKTYAEYLGLDGEELSREFKEPRQERGDAYGTPQESESDQPPISPPDEPSPSRGRTSSKPTLDPLPQNKGVGLLQAVLVLGALVAALVAFVAATKAVFPGLGTGDPPGTPPEGVKSFEVTSREHIEGNLDYAQNPPVGGNHNPVWQNCGYYAEPIRDENGVHSMEHGAVWITYSPDLPRNEVERLRGLAQNQLYVLVSPYEGLPSPVVASAWGKQLRLESVSDPDLGRFIRTYSQGPQAPEPGAPCTGGVGQPE